MRRLIKTIYLYSDGSREEVVAKNDMYGDEFIKLIKEVFAAKNASERTKCNIAVYLGTKLIHDMKFYEEENYEKLISKIVNEVISEIAKERSVKNQTILDKTSRQLGISQYRYKEILGEAILGNRERLISLLEQNVVDKNREEDLSLITHYLKL